MCAVFFHWMPLKNFILEDTPQICRSHYHLRDMRGQIGTNSQFFFIFILSPYFNGLNINIEPNMWHMKWIKYFFSKFRLDWTETVCMTRLAIQAQVNLYFIQSFCNCWPFWISRIQYGGPFKVEPLSSWFHNWQIPTLSDMVRVRTLPNIIFLLLISKVKQTKNNNSFLYPIILFLFIL